MASNQWIDVKTDFQTTSYISSNTYQIYLNSLLNLLYIHCYLHNVPNQTSFLYFPNYIYLYLEKIGGGDQQELRIFNSLNNDNNNRITITFQVRNRSLYTIFYSSSPNSITMPLTLVLPVEIIN